jgi:Cdc6-like AAA superfamily ATPase
VQEPQKPVFLVIYGPPGSGKTVIVHKLLQAMHWTLRNYAEIIVDKMLRRITGYRKIMSALRRNRTELSEDEYIDRAQRIYSGYR